MNNCKTCKWHKEDPWIVEPVKSMGSNCTCPKLREDDGYGTGAFTIDALVYSYPEDGKFWTGNEFGCIHHQPDPNIVDQIIQDFEDEKRGK